MTAETTEDRVDVLGIHVSVTHMDHTVDTFARYYVHDIVHHIHDVTAPRR